MGNSKKCPLCKKTVYMTNGRYACEECGYIINDDSSTSESQYSTQYNPYAADASNSSKKVTYTTSSVNSTSYTEASSPKKSARGLKGIVIGIFIVAFAAPLLLTRVVGCVMFNQISEVFQEVDEMPMDEFEYDYDVEVDTEIVSVNMDDFWDNLYNDEDDDLDKQVLPYSDLYKAFVTEVFGKPYDTVTKEEYASITYLHQYYYEDKIEYAINDGEILVYVHDGTKYDYLDNDIRCFTGLKVLNIERAMFYNDDSLEGLGQIEEIWTGNSVEELLTLLDNPKNVKILGLCDSYDMKSLKGLENFSNVTSLYVMGSYLEDLTGLASLKKLKELTIENGNSISDFTDLSKIEYLEKLTISSNKIKNLSILKNMTGLVCLSICNTYITDISELSKFSDTLESLVLLDNYDLDDCSVISEMTNLKKLSLECGYYSDVPDFSKLSKLTSLYLYGAGDVTKVGEAKQLTELTLESCDLENLSAISGLKSVKKLKIARPNSYIEGLSELTSMTGIEILDLSNISIFGNIQDIFSLPALKQVYLNDSRFGMDVQKLPESGTLEYLNVNGANIEKYEVVHMEYYDYTNSEDIVMSENMDMFLKFPNLSELYVSDIGIESIEVFKNLKNLKLLDISKNSISELKPISELTKLEKVWCGENMIIDSDALPEKVEVIFE